MSDKNTFDFAKTMSQYGVILGCLVGFFGAIPLTIAWFDISMIFPVTATLLIVAMCSSIIGILYGGVSGYVSGLLVSVITHFLFQDIKQQTVYKVAVGMITVCVTFMTIVTGQLILSMDFEYVFARSVSPVELQSLGLMALVFAVYGSQRVATEYLRDVVGIS
jgi:hypothetical protein